MNAFIFFAGIGICFSPLTVGQKITAKRYTKTICRDKKSYGDLLFESAEHIDLSLSIVLFQMLRVSRDNQILETVIPTPPIFMMHVFIGFQFASEMAFHHEAVLQNISASANQNLDVSIVPNFVFPFRVPLSNCVPQNF
jgi:hypothetical protein